MHIIVNASASETDKVYLGSSLGLLGVLIF